MINEAEEQFIAKAGPSVKISLRPDLGEIGVEAPHEEQDAQEVIDQGRDIGAQHAGDKIPPSTRHEGLIDHRQFEIDKKRPFSDAARWLAEQLKLGKKREEMEHAA